MILTNSKFEWLDDLPPEWDIHRVKHHFYFSKNKTTDYENFPILSLTMSGIKERKKDSNEGQLPESYEEYNLVNKDCLVFNPMDLLSGWVDIPKDEGLISPSYKTIKLKNKNINLHYIKYYFQCLYKEKVLFNFGEGVHYEYRWGLGTETLKNFPIPLPSFKEQSEIVNFLDKKKLKINLEFQSQCKVLLSIIKN